MILENFEKYTTQHHKYNDLKKEQQIGKLALGYNPNEWSIGKDNSLDNIKEILMPYPNETNEDYKARVKFLEFEGISPYKSNIFNNIISTIQDNNDLVRVSDNEYIDNYINSSIYKQKIFNCCAYLLNQPQCAIVVDVPAINISENKKEEREKLLPYFYWVDSKKIWNYEYNIQGDFQFITFLYKYTKDDYPEIDSNKITEGEMMYFIIDKDEFGYFTKDKQTLFIENNSLKEVFADICFIREKLQIEYDYRTPTGECIFLEAEKETINLFQKISSLLVEIDNHLFSSLTADVNTFNQIQQVLKDKNGEIVLGSNKIMPKSPGGILEYLQKPSFVFEQLDKYVNEYTEKIYNLMGIRDKSVVRNNESGVSKAIDYAEEESKVYTLLSSKFEQIEERIVYFMKRWVEVAGLDNNIEIEISYPDNFNLSTEDEHIEKIRKLIEIKAPSFIIKKAYKNYFRSFSNIKEKQELDKYFEIIDEITIANIDDLLVLNSTGSIEPYQLLMSIFGYDKEIAEQKVKEIEEKKLEKIIDNANQPVEEEIEEVEESEVNNQ